MRQQILNPLFFIGKSLGNLIVYDESCYVVLGVNEDVMIITKAEIFLKDER